MTIALFWLFGFASSATPATAAPLYATNGGATVNCPGGLMAATANRLLTTTATVGNLVWFDADNDGLRDPAEKGAPDVVVTASCPGTSVEVTTTTNADGIYEFTLVNPTISSYVLAFAPPPGYALTLPNQGADETTDSDPNPATGHTDVFTIGDGQSNLTLDAGLIRTVQPPAVCGTIYNDANNSGQIGQAVYTLAGWQVVASLSSGESVASGTSNAQGRYCIALPASGTPVTYNITQLVEPGWKQTFPAGVQYQVTVAPDTVAGPVDFANHNPVTRLCGLKYHDLNLNGVRDPDEPLLADWTIQAFRLGGQLANQAVTNANGVYCIPVEPGQYVVKEVQRDDFEQTAPAAGVYTVTVEPGQTVRTLHFGNAVKKPRICGVKFHDIDGDGVQDLNEPGLPGWTIQAQVGSGPIFSAVTGAQGRYCIVLENTAIGGGVYTVSEVLQSGWQQTTPTNPNTYTVNLAPGQSQLNINFGNRKLEPALCSGKKPPLQQAPNYSLTPSRLAVATCFADGVNDIYVMGIIDLSGFGSAPLHPTEWQPPMYHHPDWTRAKLGDIFGLTLDKNGNIYVTATSAYWQDIYTGAGPGAVYKIDGQTGAVSLFATLPNDAAQKPALGNITYDPAGDRFYVTNHEDGLIYQLNSSGAILTTYDHGVTGRASVALPTIPDNGTPGFTQLGRRLWGVQAYNGRLYYAVWWEDYGAPNASEANQIWSIPLNTFSTGPAQLEITLPIYGGNYSNPVSDISFSPTGALLAAERGIYGDSNPIAHQSRVLEFVPSGSGWVTSANQFDIGDIPSGVGSNPNANSAGGIDYDFAPTGWVWATGDALRFMTPAPTPQFGVVYGLQGLPLTAGSIANSTITDLNGFYWQDKNEIGDVEVACPDEAPKPPDLVIQKTHGGPIYYGQTGTYTLTVTNQGAGATTAPIIVTDQLPPGITYTAATGTGWSCSAGPVTLAGQTVTCAHAGPLAPSNSLTLVLHVNIGNLSAFPNGSTQVKNCAQVSSEGDVKPDNNSACDNTTVSAQACVKPPLGLVAWWPLDEAVGPLANDIANVNDGVHQNGPVPGAGKVSNGLSFDGSNDFVQAPNHPTLNFGASVASTALGDFSIDAWIFIKDPANVRTIVSKLGQTAAGQAGYVFFLRNGGLALTLADGAPTTYISGFTVSANQWHLVAVTVDRDQPDGIHWHVDGVEVGTRGNPMLRPSALNNNSPLRIGSSTLAVADVFSGQIDEVEIFNRAVTVAEIASIYNAGSAGKCKEFAQTPWDIPICKNQPSATVTVSVCNEDVMTHTYSIPAAGGIVGLPTGAHPSCSVNFPNPASYTVLTPQPVTVGSGQCKPVQVKINKPATLTANGQVACYSVNVQNQVSGNLFSADGTLWDQRNYCAVPISSLPVGLIRTQRFTPLSLGFTVSNTTDGPANLIWSLRVVPTDMVGENQVVRLNNNPPGQSTVGNLSLGTGGQGQIDFTVQFDQYEPFRTYDVLLETPSGFASAQAGDGQTTAAISVLASITVQATPDGEAMLLYFPVIAR